MRGFRTILAGSAAVIGGALVFAGDEAPDGTPGPLRSSTELEGFTFRHPQKFDAAVRLAAPEMREKREAARAALAEASKPSETSDASSGVPGIPDTVGADFAALGLGDQGRIAEWFDSLPGAYAKLSGGKSLQAIGDRITTP